MDGAHSVDLHPTSVVSLMRKKTTCFNGAVHEADDLANAAAREDKLRIPLQFESVELV